MLRVSIDHSLEVVGDGAGSVGDGGSEGGAAATEAAADGGRVEAAEAADDADRDLATVAATHIVAEGLGDQVWRRAGLSLD